MRIGTEPRIDVNREVEERENALLHAREGRQMTAPTAAFADDGQRQALKGLQQAFSRRVSGRPLRVADVQPGQRGLGHGQAPADPKLQQRQHPQPDGQQADQPGRMVVPLQIHRRQRQGPPFQAAHRPLDQVLVAVRQDGLLQGQLLRGLGGDIDPPAQLAHRRGHGLLVEADGHLAVPLQPHGGVPAAIAPQRALPEAVPYTGRAAGRAPDSGSGWRPPPPAGHSGRGTVAGPGGASLSAVTSACALASRARSPRSPAWASWHERITKRRSSQLVRLPSDLRGHGLQPLKPLRDQLGWAAGLGRGGSGVNGLLPRPHRRQVVGQDRRRQLGLRQRTQVVIASRLDERPASPGPPSYNRPHTAARAAPGPPGRA